MRPNNQPQLLVNYPQTCKEFVEKVLQICTSLHSRLIKGPIVDVVNKLIVCTQIIEFSYMDEEKIL